MAEPSAPSASTAAAAEQTDAERMDALDRMLTRLALADDARLAPVLARVLPYAVTSLASPAPAVRKLVSAPPLSSSPYPTRIWVRDIRAALPIPFPSGLAGSFVVLASVYCSCGEIREGRNFSSGWRTPESFVPTFNLRELLLLVYSERNCLYY